MRKDLLKYISSVFLIAFLFFGNSCITDEFRFSELTVKDDWDIEIITPLFSGEKMEFRDFVYNWYKPIPVLPGTKTVLDYSNGFYKTIPTQLIFEHSAVIDSFPFYIQGGYSFTEIQLEFNVSNGCPMPLNLLFHFFTRNSPLINVAAIQPVAFAEADFSKRPPVSSANTQIVVLDSAQVRAFNNSDRMRLTSWFDDNGFTNSHDTLSAHYQVNVNIVLYGKIKAKNEE